MDERRSDDEDVRDKAFDREMTEDDEANAPDDTGPTTRDPTPRQDGEEAGL